jgi:hypothetical protein
VRKASSDEEDLKDYRSGLMLTGDADYLPDPNVTLDFDLRVPDRSEHRSYADALTSDDYCPPHLQSGRDGLDKLKLGLVDGWIVPAWMAQFAANAKRRAERGHRSDAAGGRSRSAP